jgi:murein peptide amidase A
MAALLAALALLAPAPQASASGELLAFAQTPRGPGNLVERVGVVGRSVQGRRITLRQYGDPAWSGELLVFGCIHGDECAARGIQPLTGGCPDPSADIFVVPDLNPDGAAAHSRLNARGVDLNRNFASGWKPIGAPGNLEYSGPRPFSEPETRLARRLVRELRPAATIWFHQYRGGRHPFVRAWGPSVEAGRHFARLAGVAFRRLRWPAGSAPNWQNHTFPGSSFVVELPRGRPSPALRARLSTALVRMGRWVRED